MTNEEILKEKFSNYYKMLDNSVHELNAAMDLARKDEAVAWEKYRNRVVAMKNKESEYIVTTSCGLNFNRTYSFDELYTIFKKKTD